MSYCLYLEMEEWLIRKEGLIPSKVYLSDYLERNPFLKRLVLIIRFGL